MNPVIVRAVVNIQRKIHAENGGLRTDAHYSEGQGAIFVTEFSPLIPTNVIYVADEMTLIMHGI